MLDKARYAIESFKRQWVSGQHQDDFELSMFAAAEEEYESGSCHKGLLAKIGAEAGFDNKITKSKYLKARTAQLIGKKGAILAAMLNIQELTVKIKNLESLVQLSSDDQGPDKPADLDKHVDKIIELIVKKSIQRVTNIKFNIDRWIWLVCVSAPIFWLFFNANNQSSIALFVVLAASVLLAVTLIVRIRKLRAERLSCQHDIENTKELKRLAKISYEKEKYDLQERHENERSNQLKSKVLTKQTIRDLLAGRERSASELESLLGT